MLNILYLIFVEPILFFTRNWKIRIWLKYSILGKLLRGIDTALWGILISLAVPVLIFTWISRAINYTLSEESIVAYEVSSKEAREKEIEEYCTLIEYSDTLQDIASRHLYSHMSTCENENVMMFKNTKNSQTEFLAIKKPFLNIPKVRKDFRTGTKLYYLLFCFQAYSRYESRKSIFLKTDIPANCPVLEYSNSKEIQFYQNPYYAYIFSIADDRIELLATPFEVLNKPKETKNEFHIFEPFGKDYHIKPINCDDLEKRFPE